MRSFLPVFLLLSIIGLTGAVLAQEKKGATPPTKLVFQTKYGNVAYDHTAHAEREKSDCKVCHNSLFPQDAKAPLNFRAAMHKTAEGNHTSCGSCHHPGGTAFESKANCAKCHVKAAPK